MRSVRREFQLNHDTYQQPLFTENKMIIASLANSYSDPLRLACFHEHHVLRVFFMGIMDFPQTLESIFFAGTGQVTCTLGSLHLHILAFVA